jgi:hypothetical protein
MACADAAMAGAKAASAASDAAMAGTDLGADIAMPLGG